MPVDGGLMTATTIALTTDLILDLALDRARALDLILDQHLC
jgi:hypothetical protein